MRGQSHSVTLPPCTQTLTPHFFHNHSTPFADAAHPRRVGNRMDANFGSIAKDADGSYPLRRPAPSRMRHNVATSSTAFPQYNDVGYQGMGQPRLSHTLHPGHRMQAHVGYPGTNRQELRPLAWGRAGTHVQVDDLGSYPSDEEYGRDPREFRSTQAEQDVYDYEY